jgi:membrane-bound lytic murein transglycosylase B
MAGRETYAIGLLAAAATLLLAAPATNAARSTVQQDAQILAQTTIELYRMIDIWRSAGDPAVGAPPKLVQQAALRQQRLFLRLGFEPRRAEAVLARLRGPARLHARATIRARLAMGRLGGTRPRPVREFRTGRPLPAGVLLRHYRRAQRRFGVGWHVLAAVNFVESAFGRVRSPSSAGALGPMQFMPPTWGAYGLGGNVFRPRDAIMGAANYLRASGAPRDYWGALYAYNHSASYVEAVLRYAAQIKRDVRSFYAYYSWQVFVRTPSGLRRLTGPSPARR